MLTDNQHTLTNKQVDGYNPDPSHYTGSVHLEPGSRALAAEQVETHTKKPRILWIISIVIARTSRSLFDSPARSLCPGLSIATADNAPGAHMRHTFPSHLSTPTTHPGRVQFGITQHWRW